MPDDEVPDWMADAVRDAEERMRLAMPYVEQAQRAAEMTQRMMPAFQRAKEYAEQIRLDPAMIRSMSEALQFAQEHAEERRQALEMARSVAPIVEHMQRYAEQTRQAMAAARHLFAYADGLALATGLVPLADRAARQAEPQLRTASANLTVTPTLTADAEVVTTADSNDVDVRSEASPATRRSIDFGVLAIGLFWAFLMIMPLIAVRLSPEEQATIALYVAVIGLGLIVTWRYNDTHKD